MANSIKEYEYKAEDGSNPVYTAPDYLEGRAATDIQVWVGDSNEMQQQLVQGTDYSISGTAVTIDGYTLTLGRHVYIKRVSSPDARLTHYVDGSLLTSDTLDADANQLFYLAQEALDEASKTNLAAGTFYHAGESAPFRVVNDEQVPPPKGTLWYDISSSPNVLKVYDGANWDLAAPLRASYTFTNQSDGYFDGSAFNNSPIDSIETNVWTPSSWVFLNGVKLTEAESVSDIDDGSPSATGTGDYYYSTEGGKLYFRGITADDVLSIEVVTGGGSGVVTVVDNSGSESSGSGGGTATLDQATVDAINQAVADANQAVADTNQAVVDAQAAAALAEGYAQTANSLAVQNVSAFLDEIQTVNNNIDDVNAVAGNSSNINAVAGNSSNINDVASNKTNIDNVAANKDNIDNVAANKDNIDVVAADTAKINSIGDDLGLGDASNINKVAENLSDVQAVGTYVGLELSSGLQWFGDTDNQASVETLTEATYKANIEAITTPEYAEQLADLNEAIEETGNLWAASHSASNSAEAARLSAQDAAADAVLLEDAINVKNTVLDAKDAAVLAANTSSDKLNGWAVVDNNTISTYGSANTHLISSNTFEISAPDGVFINKQPMPYNTYTLNLDETNYDNRFYDQYGNAAAHSKISDGVFQLNFDNSFYSDEDYNSTDDYKMAAHYQGNEFVLIKYDKSSTGVTISLQKVDGTSVDTGQVFIQVYKC